MPNICWWQNGAEEDRQDLTGRARCRGAGNAECRGASAGEFVVEDVGGVSGDDAEFGAVSGVGQPARGGLGGRPFIWSADDGQLGYSGFHGRLGDGDACGIQDLEGWSAMCSGDQSPGPAARSY